MAADFLKMLLSDLKSVNSSFNRMLGIALIFSITGLLFILEPYFQYRVEKRVLQAELRESRTLLLNVDSRLSELRKVDSSVHQSLQKIRRRIDAFPSHLRSMLPRLERETPRPGRLSQAVQALQAPAPALIPAETTFEERVSSYINHWFMAILQELDRKVIMPILRIEAVSNEQAGEKLRKLSRRAMNDISSCIQEIDPGFWHTFSEKTAVAQKLAQAVEQAFEPIYAEIGILTQKMSTTEASLSRKQKSINEKLKEIERLNSELRKKLAAVQSPAGKIPLNLTDFIKIFPLLVAASLLMLILRMDRAARIHAVLMENMDSIQEEAERKAYACLIESRYLPLCGSRIRPVAAVFIIMAAITARAILLVTTHPDIFLSLTGREETVQMYLCMISYVASAVMVTGALWYAAVKMR